MVDSFTYGHKMGMSRDSPHVSDPESQLIEAKLASIKAAIVATDFSGKIIFWNELAQRLCGWAAHELVGRNLSEILPDESGHFLSVVLSQGSWGGPLHLRGKNGAELPVVASCSLVNFDEKPWGMIGIIHDWGDAARAALRPSSSGASFDRARRDLENEVRERTLELNVANDSLRELSGRLLRTQDEERRRIARELHDSVGQLLAAVSINSSSIEAEASKLGPTAARALSENAELIAEINREIRTISHLLHPPLLDEAGLASALSWYVRGFSERSKIEVVVDIAADFVRPPEEMEIALFRIVQESLTNIHRHSGSERASVRLSRTDAEVMLEVRDFGKGMAKKTNAKAREGVGIRGMRERIRQIGGSLEISSDAAGTVVTATLPVENKQATQIGYRDDS